MLNIVSILVGLVALLFAIPGILPFLGLLNWLAVPIALLGLAVGVLSRRPSGARLNAIILIVGVVRLFFGGGLF